MGKSTIFVAVHGIGDQKRNETIQAVAKQVYAHEGEVSGLPLGAFPSPDEIPTYKPHFPGLKTSAFGEIGFAEIYWAGVTRARATEGYSLEETKQWARTLVQRLQKRKPGENKVSTMRQIA